MAISVAQTQEIRVCIESLRQDVKDELQGQKQQLLDLQGVLEREIHERQREDQNLARAVNLLQQAQDAQSTQNATRAEEIGHNVQVMFKAMQQEKADLKTWMQEVSANLEVAQAELFREFREELKAGAGAKPVKGKSLMSSKCPEVFEAGNEPSLISKPVADESQVEGVDLSESRSELLSLIEDVVVTENGRGEIPTDIQDSIRRLQQGLETLVDQRLGSIVSLVDKRLEALVQEGRLHQSKHVENRSMSPSPSSAPSHPSTFGRNCIASAATAPTALSPADSGKSAAAAPGLTASTTIGAVTAGLSASLHRLSGDRSSWVAPSSGPMLHSGVPIAFGSLASSGSSVGPAFAWRGQQQGYAYQAGGSRGRAASPRRTSVSPGPSNTPPVPAPAAQTRILTPPRWSAGPRLHM